MTEQHIEESSAPLIEHLIELRKRLVWSLIALGIFTVICFVFRFQMWDFLSGPLMRADPDAVIQSLSPQETFFTFMNLAIWGGFFFGFPFIAWQVWLFVAPGLYKSEQGAFAPFLIATPFLFCLGAALAYYLVIPLALQFLIAFAENTATGGAIAIENNNRFSEYVGFIKVMLLAFGMSFQLPVLLTLMGRVGLITSAQLASGRKYAVVGIAAAAALITPPDVISQFLLGIPVYILYEVSIHIVAVFDKRRAEQDAADAEEFGWDDEDDEDDIDHEKAEKGL
ncbi:MAG: twin-arginine translocase subunit TatC [Pseudomonadota bacterium]